MLGRDQRAVAPIDKAIEEGLCKEIIRLLPRHAMFLRQRECLSQRLDGGAEQEVAGKFDNIGSAGVIPKVKDPLPHGLLQRPHPCSCRGVP